MTLLSFYRHFFGDNLPCQSRMWRKCWMKTICFQMISQDTGQLLLLLLLTSPSPSQVQGQLGCASLALDLALMELLLRIRNFSCSYSSVTKHCKNCECCPVLHVIVRPLWLSRLVFGLEIQRATQRPVLFDESDEETRPDHDLNMTMLGKPHVRKIHVQPEFCQIADALWQVFFTEN